MQFAPCIRGDRLQTCRGETLTGGDVAETPVTWLAIRDDQKAFEEQQLRALRSAFPDLEEAAPAQLGIFFHYCKASGLDPFGRQIYMIKRTSRGRIRWTIQTGIDGYRLIARRAADRSGQPLAYEDFVWFDSEGGEHNVWLRDEPPAACRAVLWRGDSRFPAVAHWREYAPKVWDYEAQEYKLGGLWPQMPASQLSKVAEALALRRACPADLSGLQVDEEMHAADAAESRERVEAEAQQLRKPATPADDRPRDVAAGPMQAQKAQDAEEIHDAEVIEERETEADPLTLARDELQRAARALTLPFSEVNDACFDLTGVAYQDATASQLNDLAQLLSSSADLIGTPQMASRIAAFRAERADQQDEAGERPTRKSTVKKSGASKRASRRTSSPATTDTPKSSTRRRTPTKATAAQEK
ncbi:recombinase RecT [Streptomyces sp. TRM66268-LWL]|uniref:Recombinase RecT n=1 Tax=Streptomyces polyasparticus TaxID=2767826 RepID=A0ABR7SQM7_9ACTN|nr:recombinase RecT [Streptomyces polyasparticus]MBC9717796.1 recombinase RecT [Streptomyces polyasparticus]